MNPHWRRYGLEMRRYARYFFLAPLIALIPFMFNLRYWREHGGLWTGFRGTIVFGTAIGLMIAIFFSGFYAVLTWIAVRTGRFHQPPLLINILLGSLGAMAGMWIVDATRGPQSGEPVDSPPLLSALILSGMIATGFALYFAFRQAKEESLKLRAESAEARYHALEHQMRPHFLFNALNSLAELIESGQPNAAETTYKLSDLYRRILANSGLKTARLDSELEIARAYLELEQLRFGARLNFTLDAPAGSGELYLPSLMLQTLVENAVKHGIAPSIEGGQIKITITQQPDNRYRLYVTNTGARYQPQVSTGGTGLANTQARLDLLYGNGHQFELRGDEGGATVASFVFSGEKID